MSLKIIPTPEFTKSVKKLFKRYKQIGKDLAQLEEELLADKYSGIDLGGHCYKLPLANSSVPTGKSGGFRVIYYLKVEDIIYLLTIYSKSDLENIDEKRLVEIIVENGL